jgi:hypothetical protein
VSAAFAGINPRIRPATSRGRPAKDREMTRKDGLRRVGKRAGQVALPDIRARSGFGSERASNPRVAIDSVLPSGFKEWWAHGPWDATPSSTGATVPHAGGANLRSGESGESDLSLQPKFRWPAAATAGVCAARGQLLAEAYPDSVADRCSQSCDDSIRGSSKPRRRQSSPRY